MRGQTTNLQRVWYFVAVMNVSHRLVVALVIASTVAGCGYHLVGTTSTLPEEVETLYLARFQNQTDWADMDQRLIEALSLEWVRRRRLTLVDQRAGTDLALEGVILRVGTAPVSFDDRGRATEYQMTLTTSVQLFDIRGDEPKLMWEDLAFSRRTSYVVPPDAENYFDRQFLAMDSLASEYSSALVSAVLEGF
jgi:outer membrane lipopolysaccharide assembly protein LptE/RlpB